MLVLPWQSLWAQTPGDDPAARAMGRIQVLVEERLAAAERALAASRPVGEIVEARKPSRGDESISAPPAPPNRDRSRIESPGPIGRTMLARYNTYRDILTRILAEEQLPVEVLSVALVESGFNPLALSPKGALGIWQLMPATAQRYGLTVEPGNDHRTHPEHATRAAARYLRDLYRMFGDWKLALAAYNAGEGRVQQAINRAGVRDFDELSRRRLLPLETRAYVPSVLAAWSRLGSAPK
ncbi:MAG: lytic transglycosylase domain-containing protein [Blastocatellales bacterium]|nr:lytic transglycosylase domain-containing protein [Blastocatellales bacterium]